MEDEKVHPLQAPNHPFNRPIPGCPPSTPSPYPRHVNYVDGTYAVVRDEEQEAAAKLRKPLLVTE